MSSEHRPSALAGVRVLSLGAFIAGNGSARALADLGADVVKIEARARPEILRNPAYGYDDRVYREPSGVTNTPMYAALVRGARGLSLDMHVPQARDLFRRLVAVSDVVIENFGGTAMARWECAFDDLLEHNPRLVMLSLSGYGRTGPRASYLAYASNISNFTGLTATWANHGTYSDQVTAAHCALAAVAARSLARRTGRGICLDAAQIEVVAAVMAPVLLEPLVNGRDVGRVGNDVPGSPLAGVFPCHGEDRWVAVELEDLDDWSVLCDLLQRPDLVAAADDDLGSLRGPLHEALTAWTSERSPHTAAHLLQRAGLAAGAVQGPEDVVRDPHLRQRGFPVELDQPDLGVLEYAGSPHRMTKTPGAIHRSGPRVGEHTDEVLHEWLGLATDELESLESAGAIFRAH